MRRLRAAAWLAAAAVLMAAAPPPELHGPLSDFWGRVKRDWSQRLTALNRGHLQTAIWVAMIWDGPDELAMEGIVSRLQEREARRWVRAQITKDRYREIAHRDLGRMQALRQHLILLGTSENALIARALALTPLRAGRGYVSIGGRRLAGDGLLLFAITPNPIDPRKYALVISGSSGEALLQAGEVPYGDTDYIVYRGRKVLERGYFKWSRGVPSTDSVTRYWTFTDHFGWAQRESEHFRLRFDPAATPAAEVERLGRRIDDELEEATAFYGIGDARAGKIDLYLYGSMDEKVNQTADPRPAHVEQADGSLHVVWSGSPGGLDAWDVSLASRVLLRRSESYGGTAGSRELPGLWMALSFAARDRFQTVPLAVWAGRSTRDIGFVPMDVLFSRSPADLVTGDLSVLDAAAFVRDLTLRAGAERIALFCRTARRSDFHGRFKEVFGLSIAQAEARWLEGVSKPEAPEGGMVVEDRRLAPIREALRRRDDRQAELMLSRLEPGVAVLTLRARIHFRAGRFDEAATEAEEALATPGGSGEDRAWARLTLARSRAMLGLTVAAGADLKSSEILEGPGPVRVIAEFWLEHLGEPLNRRAANQMLVQQAGADLMNFDWESAEAKLRSVLASDPQSREAHAALGQVYLSKYVYWHDWMLLDRELFPGTSMADPDIYGYLADKGREELQRAAAMPFGEEERWMFETGPVEPGVEQPMIHLLIGRALLMQGNPDSARREIETALELEPANRLLRAVCHLYLARIAAAAGDRTKARAEYEAVLERSVGGEVARVAKEELRNLGPALEAF